jgi:hypothetical protein
MAVVPKATPVTSPDKGLTVAMVASLLDQVPPETVEVKVVIPATQTA